MSDEEKDVVVASAAEAEGGDSPQVVVDAGDLNGERRHSGQSQNTDGAESRETAGDSVGAESRETNEQEQASNTDRRVSLSSSPGATGSIDETIGIGDTDKTLLTALPSPEVEQRPSAVIHHDISDKKNLAEKKLTKGIMKKARKDCKESEVKITAKDCNESEVKITALSASASAAPAPADKAASKTSLSKGSKKKNKRKSSSASGAGGK